MKLFDTSVAIDYLRGVPQATALITELVDQGESLLASELVRFELLAGVRDKELEALERFFLLFTWIPVAEEITRVAAAFARRHRPAYSGIDDVDYLIGATARVLAADLLTTNVRHFPMFPDLAPAY